MTQCELPIFAGKGDSSSVLEIAAKEADRPFTEHGGRVRIGALSKPPEHRFENAQESQTQEDHRCNTKDTAD
jgi:hypothetical protein